MAEDAVSDTGPLLHLAEIDADPLLLLFRGIYIPTPVKDELVRIGFFGRITASLSDRLQVEPTTQSEIEVQRSTLVGFHLHHADLGVAALADRLRPDVVLTDDLELRKAMQARGHTVAGTVGVLTRAFKRGRISKAELYRLVDLLSYDSTLHLSRGFRAYLFRLLEELSE